MPAKRPLSTVALSAVAGTALLAGATACGNNSADRAGAQPGVSAGPANAIGAISATSTPGSGSDLASLSSAQIVQRMKSAMTGVTSVRISGTAPAKGRTVSLDLDADKQGNCTGTVNIPGTGGMELRHTGSHTWIKPDDTFWRDLAAKNGKPEQGDRAVQMFKGRFLTGSDDDLSLQQVAHSCDIVNKLSTLFRDNGGGETKGAPTTVNGVPAIPLTDSDNTSTGYIAAQGTPYVLRVADTKQASNAQIDFTDYNKPVVVEEPSADEVVDISNFKQKLSV
jgi:hypothetical protein